MLPGRSRLTRHCQARRSYGFTLVEVLVSLSLFSLLTYTAFAGLQSGSRTWEVGNERTEALADLRIVRGFARRYLGGAFPLLLKDDNGKDFIGFEGEARSVTFYSEMPAHLGAGGVYKMRLWLDREGEFTQLKMSRTLLGAEDDRGPLGGIGSTGDAQAAYFTERALAERLTDGGFSYFGAEEPDDEPQWRDTWIEQATMPLAVGLRLANETGPWPEMVMRLRLDEPRRLKGEKRASANQGADAASGSQEASSAQDDPPAATEDSQ